MDDADVAIEVDVAPGELPPAWDRATVFFANLRSLFFGNELASKALHDMLGCNLDSYGGRLASILDLLFHAKDGTGNLLVVDSPPHRELTSYLRDELSLAIPEVLVCHPERYGSGKLIDAIASSGAGWIDGLVTDPSLQHIAERTGTRCYSTPEGSHLANNKLEFHRELDRLGLLTFDTEIADTPGDLDDCYGKLARMGYRFAAVKSQIGASGIGVIKCDTRFPDPVPELIFHEGACLVQGWIEPGIKAVRHIHSPSVQLFVTDQRVVIFDTTDQILDHQSVHEGNMAPPHLPGSITPERAELIRQANEIAPWLHGTGYRGPASIDFHVARRGECVDIRACEINARVTGATYPSLLARHFHKSGAWLMRNLALPRPLAGSEILDILQRTGALFSPASDRGCLPINFNDDLEGNINKGQFLFLAPDVDDAADQLARLVSLPEIELHYDRD